MYERHEAIILHALPYQEYDKILTLFSREGGVIKAIVQRATAKKAIAGATDPLTRVEIMLKPGKNDLFKCGDITVLSQYLKLREQLDRLKAACAIAQIIQQSQMPQKPTPILYSLLTSYLEQIPSLKNLTALVDSFYLKLLRHDGSLLIEPHCSTCKAHLTDGFLVKGESLCRNHAPPHAIAMSLMELKTIHDLTHAKTYTEIENLNVSKNLSLKIKELIDDARA